MLRWRSEDLGAQLVGVPIGFEPLVKRLLGMDDHFPCLAPFQDNFHAPKLKLGALVLGFGRITRFKSSAYCVADSEAFLPGFMLSMSDSRSETMTRKRVGAIELPWAIPRLTVR